MKLVILIVGLIFMSNQVSASTDIVLNNVKNEIILKKEIKGGLTFEKEVFPEKRTDFKALIYKDENASRHIVYADKDIDNVLIGFDQIEYAGLKEEAPGYGYIMGYEEYFRIKNGISDDVIDMSLFNNKDLFYFKFKGGGKEGTAYILDNWLANQAEGGWGIFDSETLADIKYQKRFSEIRVYPVAREEISPTAKKHEILEMWEKTSQNMRYEWRAESNLAEWCDANWQSDTEALAKIRVKKYLNMDSGMDEEDAEEKHSAERERYFQRYSEKELTDDELVNCKVKIYRKLLKNGILLKKLDIDIIGEFIYDKIRYSGTSDSMSSLLPKIDLFSGKAKVSNNAAILKNNSETEQKNLIYYELKKLGYAESEIADIDFHGAGSKVFHGAQGCRQDTCKAMVMDKKGQFLFKNGSVVTLAQSKASAGDTARKSQANTATPTSSEKSCPKGGEIYPAEFVFCPKHGVPLSQE